MFRQSAFGLLFLIISYTATQGQEVEVRGKFQVDSIKIGVIFPYSLTATYPKTTSIVFPDSTYSFAPFEINHKTFFPTQTKGGTSYDSVVYYLTTFEIDSIQQLALPVFIVHRADCTVVSSVADSVYLQQLIAHVPDSVSTQKLPLKTNTAYHAVSWLLNYPLLLIIGGILLVALIAIWIIFGKRIRKYFILKKLNRKHRQFISSFEGAVAKFQSQKTPSMAESALVLWKNYMEQLLSSPFTKYTTKEIFQLVKDESLGKSLKTIDHVIYSNEVSLDNDSFSSLRNFSEQRFQQKLQEVKNG